MSIHQEFETATGEDNLNLLLKAGETDAGRLMPLVAEDLEHRYHLDAGQLPVPEAAQDQDVLTDCYNQTNDNTAATLMGVIVVSAVAVGTVEDYPALSAAMLAAYTTVALTYRQGANAVCARLAGLKAKSPV